MKFLKVVTIIVSLIVVGGSLTYRYYEKLKEEEFKKVAIEKENYKSIVNPYYLNNLIEEGYDVNSYMIDFFYNKSKYYQAQKELDLGNYKEALGYTDKIFMRSFCGLKSDLEGDIYLYMGEKEKALNEYNEALYCVSKENVYLRNSILAKISNVFLF